MASLSFHITADQAGDNGKPEYYEGDTDLASLQLAVEINKTFSQDTELVRQAEQMPVIETWKPEIIGLTSVTLHPDCSIEDASFQIGPMIQVQALIDVYLGASERWTPLYKLNTTIPSVFFWRAPTRLEDGEHYSVIRMDPDGTISISSGYATGLTYFSCCVIPHCNAEFSVYGKQA